MPRQDSILQHINLKFNVLLAPPCHELALILNTEACISRLRSWKPSQWRHVALGLGPLDIFGWFGAFLLPLQSFLSSSSLLLPFPSLSISEITDCEFKIKIKVPLIPA